MSLREFFFDGYQNGPIHIIGWQVLYFIVLFSILAWVLGRFLFKPILAVVERREVKVQKAEQSAREAQKRLEDSSSTGQQAILEARREAFHLRDEAQKAATDEGEAILDKTRSSVQTKISSALGKLETEMESNRETLKQDAEEMARSIAYRALGRKEA